MDLFDNRLSTVFQRLRESELVAKKIINETTIADFSKELNKAIPTTDCETGIGDFMRYLYSRNKTSFYKFIYINNLEHYVLITDGAPIVSMLGIPEVSIRWNQQLNQYDIGQRLHSRKPIYDRKTKQSVSKYQTKTCANVTNCAVGFSDGVTISNPEPTSRARMSWADQCGTN